MDINFLKKGRTLIVIVAGEIDHHTSCEIRNKIDNQILRGNLKNIVFDFANVSFMDSSGVGMLIGRFRNVENYGGRVCVTNVSCSIDRIFSISGLYKLIEGYATVNDALKSL